MCLMPAREGATRIQFELDPDRGRVQVIDPDSGRLLLVGDKAALPQWIVETPPSERQLQLLELVGALAAHTTAAAATPVTNDLASTEPRRVRRKIWELKSSYHCPVIGTCATVSELRKVARQARLQSAMRLTDYAVHSSFVALAGEKCPASRQLNKLLDRKYARYIKQFSEAENEKALRRLWLEARTVGDIAGALWALISHPKTSAKLAQEVYQEIHMMSHQLQAAKRAELQRLAELERETRRLERELQRNAVKSAQSLAANSRHIDSLIERLARSKEAEARLEALENGTAILEYQERIDRLERDLAEALLRIARAERKAQQQAERMVEQQKFPPVTPSVEWRQSDTCAACENDYECCQIDLCGRCVLCVGGLTGTADRYRRLVEGCNGRFLHHDGGVEDNAHRLGSLLQRADAVVCPADCVSHDAARRIKRYCKRYDKTCLFLRSSGTGAFSSALNQLVVNGREHR